MEKERRINTDKYGNALLSVKDGKEALLKGMDIDFAVFDDAQEVDIYNKYTEQILGYKAVIRHPENQDLDMAVYHRNHACEWNIPDYYKQLDAKEFILMLCESQVEIDRVEMEYAMFEERGLEPLLQFLIYIVDYMRKYEIVWGVGRGSSVASYCLYLLGVHKIDSLKYDLPIEEFLK